MPTLLSKLLRRAAGPLARLYYPLFFDRRVPFTAAAGRLMRRLEALGSGGDLPLSRESWEAQYGEGRWACLRAKEELARYREVVRLLVERFGARTVLDVGCGEAILRDLLRAEDYDRYLGVDLAEAAIAVARRGARPGDRLVVADAEAWQADESFDAVVMNECLYYFHDPLAQAERYFAAVAPGGALVVSMFESPRTRGILRALGRRLPAAERVRLTGARGTWLLAVFPGQAEEPR